MDVSLFLLATDQTALPVEVAREAEARGFESLFLPEHTHIPVGNGSRHPMGLDAVPDYYRRFLDPLVGLAAASSATTTLRQSRHVCVLAAPPDSLDVFEELGIDRALLTVPPTGRDAALVASTATNDCSTADRCRGGRRHGPVRGLDRHSHRRRRGPRPCPRARARWPRRRRRRQ